MVRALILAGAGGLAVVAGRPAVRSVPPACSLLTSAEASRLTGMPVVTNADDAARKDFSCRFNPWVGRGTSETSPYGAEITWRVFSDAQIAHAYFPRWMLPIALEPADPPGTQVQGIGDEARITHGKIANSIGFRRGAVLVRIITDPGATDSALKVAGATMAGRL